MEFLIILPFLFGGLAMLIVAITQMQRAQSAERREREYRIMCEELEATLRRSNATITKLIAAMPRRNQRSDA